MELPLAPSPSLRLKAVNPRCKTCPVYQIKPTVAFCRSSCLLLETTKGSNSVPLYFHRTVSIRNCRRKFIWVCSQVGASEPEPVLNKFLQFKDAFWRFLRPHTIRGTALGSVALVARALIENSDLIKWSLLPKAFSGVLALICGNGFIVGINQIYDIGIDKYAASVLIYYYSFLSIPIYGRKSSPPSVERDFSPP